MSINKELTDFINLLKNHQKSDFITILTEGMELFGFFEDDVANLFDVTCSTIIRWKKGVTIPHYTMLPFLYYKLEREANKRIFYNSRKNSYRKENS